jgi:hypothetical protein
MCASVVACRSQKCTCTGAEHALLVWSLAGTCDYLLATEKQRHAITVNTHSGHDTRSCYAHMATARATASVARQMLCKTQPRPSLRSAMKC